MRRPIPRRRWCLGLGALLALLGAGCDSGPPPPLRVGYNNWPGYEPLYLAQELGFYEGRTIQLMDFPSTTEVMRAYRNGTIDVAAVTVDEALLLAETLPDQRIILVCDFSNGADAILARPPFASMPDLRGRRIGVEPNALGAYMLARALELSGMTAAEVTVVPVTLAEHEAAYAADRVDAIVTFEPSRSRLLAAGARRVFDSAQIPGEIVDVLLTRPEPGPAQTESLAALVRGWFRALDHLRRQPQDAARRLVPRTHVTPEIFLQSLAGLELPDRAANLRLLGGSPDNLAETLRKLSTVMITHQLLSRATASKLQLDDSVVKAPAR